MNHDEQNLTNIEDEKALNLDIYFTKNTQTWTKDKRAETMNHLHDLMKLFRRGRNNNAYVLFKNFAHVFDD